MTDPLSITASILTILDITNRVISWGKDVKNAPKERRQFLQELESLNFLLEKLDERYKKAPKDETWLRGLWGWREELDKNRVLVRKPKGVVPRLHVALEEMALKLEPRSNKLLGDLTWHWSKERVAEMLKDIYGYCGVIRKILDLKQDETLDLIQEDTKTIIKISENATVQLGYVSVDTKIIIKDLGMLQDEQRRQSEKFNAESEKAEKAREEQRSQWERKRRLKEEEERMAIASWLSPLADLARQDDLFTECFQDTGEWLLESETFKDWVEGRPMHLRCFGQPGVGKTVLSSLVAHYLKKHPAYHDSPVLSLYLDYKASKQQTLTNLFGSLLKQLIQLRGSSPIPEELRNLYDSRRLIDRGPDFKGINAILRTELQEYEKSYIVVDGFDEYPSRDRNALRNALYKLLPEKLRLIITSRGITGEFLNDIEIECDRCEIVTKRYNCCQICNSKDGGYDVCDSCMAQGLLCLEESHKLSPKESRHLIEVVIPDEDIERYVNWELKTELIVEEMDLRDPRTDPEPSDTTRLQDIVQDKPGLVQDIISTVVEKASGRFLYAKLYMDSLKVTESAWDVSTTLRGFPDNIEEIYEQAMERVMAQDGKNPRTACRILALIVYAYRFMSLLELQHALAAQTLGKEKKVSEKNIKEAMIKRNVILDCTIGFVTIDNGDSAVKLVHRSLEDYLKRNQAKWLPEAEIGVAEACLTYLSLTLPPNPCLEEVMRAKGEEFPFMKYASQYWGDHVRRADSHLNVREAALRLIHDHRRLDACLQVAWVTDIGARDSWDVSTHVDRLHVLAWYGLSFAISGLRPEEIHVDVTEPKYGQTPLMYACRKGHVQATTQLLDLGASPALMSSRGRTALFEAIEADQDQIVNLLIERRDPDLQINRVHPKESNRTALMLAAQFGNLSMVRAILEHHNVQVNLRDKHGLTALCLAARENHYDVVKYLLKPRDPKTEVDAVDRIAGRSALILATERNHHTIVRLLLENNAKSALKDRQGGTAMLRAVNRRCCEALHILIHHGADLHCTDEDGQSLLHGASKRGDLETALLLIEKGLKVNAQDNFGLTPLHSASTYDTPNFTEGKYEVAEALLDQHADPSIRDNSGRTPYEVAWQYGQTEIMDMLSDGAEPKADSQLPIWALAKRSLTDPLTHALDAHDPSIPIPTEPTTLNTPVHCAVQVSNPSTLSLLLDSSSALAADTPNHYGRTPLHLAALHGDLGCTSCLITHLADTHSDPPQAVFTPLDQLNARDRWFCTPLYLAQQNRHYAVMLALIEAGAHIDKEIIDIQIIFFHAVEQGNVRCAEILLKHGANRSERDEDGILPKQMAEAHGDGEMMRALRNAPTIYMQPVGEEVEEGDEKGMAKEGLQGGQQFGRLEGKRQIMPMRLLEEEPAVGE